MEYLFQINPILRNEPETIIYGVGEEQKRIFFALLQQNITVTAFCLKKEQKTGIKRIFNKKIYSLQEVIEEHSEAWIVLSAQDAKLEYEAFRKMGLVNIIIENITAEKMGVLLEEEF